MNNNQSIVYYHKTDLLYNLVSEKDGIMELHLNCPHIKTEQIIFVSSEEIEMVEDVNDPFDPSDYGFKGYVLKSDITEWIEDWELKRDDKEYSVYRNGFLYYNISLNRIKNIPMYEQRTLFFGRIPSKTDGDIIMKNLGFKRKENNNG